MLRLHGVPLSQPFRSVAWTLLQKRVPFEVSLCVPGSGGKRGSKGEAYLALNPLGTVPLLEDGPVKVVESAAILQYLSSKHGWTDLYPASLSDRARVDAFCHWHHGGTRQLAGGFYAPHVRPDMAEKFGEDGIARAKKSGMDALNTLETAWLAADPFLAGANATLADLIAYEEVAQLAPKFGNVLTYEGTYPKVAAWLERMAALPYHDEAHVALKVMGDLAAPNELPMMKRLGAATKAGMEAIAAANAATAKL